MNKVLGMSVVNNVTRIFIRNKGTFNWNQLLNDENKKKCLEKFKSNSQIKLTNREPKTFAAVLIPIVKTKNGISILYNLRSSKLSSHTRQVSFPGGSKDHTDNDFIDCALRETEEEIGIPRSQINIWGKGQLLISYLDPAIMPVIGFVIDYDPNKLKINNNEVEKVFTVPIETLCSENSKQHTQFRAGYSVPTFLGGEEKIWGITAVLTYQFLTALLPKELYQHNIKFISNYKTIS